MRLVVGCCCSAALIACGGTPPPPPPVPSPSARGANLPRFDEVWDEEFAANVTLKRLELEDAVVLVPDGLQLPPDTKIGATTEATLLLIDEPGRIQTSVEQSLTSSGYELVADGPDAMAWTGRGMAIRLEAHADAQLIAWAPEERLGDLVQTN